MFEAVEVTITDGGWSDALRSLWVAGPAEEQTVHTRRITDHCQRRIIITLFFGPEKII